MAQTGKIIGIDLGTTNSCIAVMEGGEATVIPNAEGARTTPSIVASKSGKEGDERLVGDTAKRQRVMNALNTVFSAKRFIGRKFTEVKAEAAQMPFPVRQGSKGEAEIVFEGSECRPAQISAIVLQKLKADAEKYLGGEVAGAVITVPAYFNDSQRQATKDAGRIAGLEVKRIINEPTAAALAYGLGDANKEQKIAVYDLGGGTFDVSLLEMGDGVFEVLSTNGDTHLGGDDFDSALITHLLSEFKKESGVDISADETALQRVKEAAEKAKIELSAATETEVNLPFLTADASGPKHFVHKVSRAKFESLTEKLVEQSLAPCKKALKDAKLSASDIDTVILVGGQTRMPAVQAAVEQFFGKKPHAGVNPDEVVALGAAIQGGILAGDVKDVVLLDVTPLSLAIETRGGIATNMIERNTTIPTKKAETFSTAAPNQNQVEIHITQGEREFSADNKSLGRFILDGIPPAPAGVPQIEVTFDIDASGILHVSAHDKGSDKKQHITIQGSSGLSEEEVEKMRAEAEKHAEADKQRREATEVRNALESAAESAEKLMNEATEKSIDKALIDEVKQERDAARELLAKEEVDNAELKTAAEKLGAALQKLGAEFYKKQEANTDGTGTDSPPPPDGEGEEIRDEGGKDEEKGEEKEEE